MRRYVAVFKGISTSPSTGKDGRFDFEQSEPGKYTIQGHMARKTGKTSCRRFKIAGGVAGLLFFLFFVSFSLWFSVNWPGLGVGGGGGRKRDEAELTLSSKGGWLSGLNASLVVLEALARWFAVRRWGDDARIDGYAFTPGGRISSGTSTGPCLPAVL